MIGFKPQILICTLFLIVAGASAADQAPAPAQGEGARRSRRACWREAGDVAKSVDSALKDVRDARKLEDPAKLKDALTTAETALQKAHDHMSACSPAMRGPRGDGMGMRGRGMRRGPPVEEPQETGVERPAR